MQCSHKPTTVADQQHAIGRSFIATLVFTPTGAVPCNLQEHETGGLQDAQGSWHLVALITTATLDLPEVLPCKSVDMHPHTVALDVTHSHCSSDAAACTKLLDIRLSKIIDESAWLASSYLNHLLIACSRIHRYRVGCGGQEMTTRASAIVATMLLSHR